MARDLLEGDPGSADFLRQAEDRLAMPLGRLMVEGPEAELQATENAQPAILFHSLALLRRLVTNGIEPGAVAGHSMGAFAGLVAGGALDPLDALVAVRARGAAMSAAAPPASGMIAVLGLPDDTVEQICAASEGLVVVANYNAPGQVVISGSESGLNAVSPKLQAAGAKRLVRLPVSGAFHSPLMAGAARVFAAAWAFCRRGGPRHRGQSWDRSRGCHAVRCRRREGGDHLSEPQSRGGQLCRGGFARRRPCHGDASRFCGLRRTRRGGRSRGERVRPARHPGQ